MSSNLRCDDYSIQHTCDGIIVSLFSLFSFELTWDWGVETEVVGEIEIKGNEVEYKDWIVIINEFGTRLVIQLLHRNTSQIDRRQHWFLRFF